MIYLLCLRYADSGPAERSPYYKIGGTKDMRQRLSAYAAWKCAKIEGTPRKAIRKSLNVNENQVKTIEKPVKIK